jgi:hypothetical protein
MRKNAFERNDLCEALDAPLFGHIEVPHAPMSQDPADAVSTEGFPAALRAARPCRCLMFDHDGNFLDDGSAVLGRQSTIPAAKGRQISAARFRVCVRLLPTYKQVIAGSKSQP